MRSEERLFVGVRFFLGHHAHVRALALKQFRRGLAGAFQPDYEHVCVRQIHLFFRYLQSRLCKSGYLSFNVVSANNAITRPAIQNRTITFDSGQPSASKWWWIGAILKMRLPPRSL